MKQLLEKVHPEWQAILENALSCVDANYLLALKHEPDWLPGFDQMLAAFAQPLSSTNYILLGESPYPRPQSANGYAFWDAAVKPLWSASGFSKEVNRATSLRNFLKMLLLARGDLSTDFSQPAIAVLDKSSYWQTADEFFTAMLSQGFLLLNASLVFAEDKVRYHAQQWQPFVQSLFKQLAVTKPSIKLVLFGKIAAAVPDAHLFPCVLAEHPYNLTFITNPVVLDFFKPMDLLSNHA